MYCEHDLVAGQRDHRPGAVGLGVHPSHGANVGRNVLDQAADFRELGVGFYKKENYLDAIAELSKAVNVNPDDEIAIEYLSLSYFNQAMKLFGSKCWEIRSGIQTHLKIKEIYR